MVSRNSVCDSDIVSKWRIVNVWFNECKVWQFQIKALVKYSPTCSTNWIDFISCVHNLKTVIKKKSTPLHTLSLTKTSQNPPTRMCLKFCDFASFICPGIFKEETIKVNPKRQCCSLKSPRTLFPLTRFSNCICTSHKLLSQGLWFMDLPWLPCPVLDSF